MMRWLFGVLLLCNAVALAWQWDAFARWGWGPNVNREPERLQQQIRPEALTITLPPRLDTSEAAAAPAEGASGPAASGASSDASRDAASAPASQTSPATEPSSAPSSAPAPSATRPAGKADR